MLIADTIQYTDVPVRADFLALFTHNITIFLTHLFSLFLYTSLLALFMLYYYYLAQQYFSALYVSLSGIL